MFRFFIKVSAGLKAQNICYFQHKKFTSGDKFSKVYSLLRFHSKYSMSNFALQKYLQLFFALILCFRETVESSEIRVKKLSVMIENN